MLVTHMRYILGQFLGSSTQNGRGEGGINPISFHFMHKFYIT